MRQYALRRRSRTILAGCILLGTLGCASLEKRAPLVTPSLTTIAASRGIGPDALERGRALYVGQCARCHTPVAVTSRSARQWQVILPRMAELTKLDFAEQDDLEAYVETVVSAPPGP